MQNYENLVISQRLEKFLENLKQILSTIMIQVGLEHWLLRFGKTFVY
jgi:hypothetical protein